MKTCLRCGEEIPESVNICDKCKEERKSVYESSAKAPEVKEVTILDFVSISSGVLLLMALISLPSSKFGSFLFLLSATLLTPFGEKKILGPFMKQAEFKWYQSGFVAFVLFIICSIVASGTPNKFEPDQEVLQAIANATPTPEAVQTANETALPTVKTLNLLAVIGKDSANSDSLLGNPAKSGNSSEGRTYRKYSENGADIYVEFNESGKAFWAQIDFSDDSQIAGIESVESALKFVGIEYTEPDENIENQGLGAFHWYKKWGLGRVTMSTFNSKPKHISLHLNRD